MIVEDELFQNTRETGYRFCISDNKGTFGRIFSAHWDPNNADRMYLCSQDGHMKSLKIETNEFKVYKILFRFPKFCHHSTQLCERNRLVKDFLKSENYLSIC